MNARALSPACLPLACPNIIELVSSSSDADWSGLGSSPYLGDMGRVGIAVPALATVSQSTRYLFRLVGINIPNGGAIRILSIRTLATIRAVIEDEEAGRLVRELEINSPDWSFPDGNISWHLRHEPRRYSRQVSVLQNPGTSPNNWGLGTALLFKTNAIDNYVPPGKGVPPGDSVGPFGTMRSLMFPWYTQERQLDIWIDGPGRVVLYASVHQPNPDNRPAYPAVTDPGALRHEDRFLYEFTDLAQYGRVAGAMSVQLYPGGRPT